MIDERYLDHAQEEAAEFIAECSKVKRFGPHDKWEGVTCLDRLYKEAGDVLALMQCLGLIGNVQPTNLKIIEAIAAKHEKLKIFGPDGLYIKSTKGE